MIIEVILQNARCNNKDSVISNLFAKLVLYDDLAYILLRIETGTQKVRKSVLMRIFIKVIEIS